MRPRGQRQVSNGPGVFSGQRDLVAGKAEKSLPTHPAALAPNRPITANYGRTKGPPGRVIAALWRPAEVSQNAPRAGQALNLAENTESVASLRFPKPSWVTNILTLRYRCSHAIPFLFFHFRE